MAAIDRALVITRTAMFIPEENVLTDTELESLLELIIATQIPEDDEQYTAMASCLLLVEVGNVNKQRNPSEGNLRRDKQIDSELEWYSNPSFWDDYLGQVGNSCRLLDYDEYNQKSKLNRITVWTREPFDVNPYD